MLVSQSGFFKKQSLGLELGYWILDMGFPCDSAGKESACNEGHLGLIPGLGRSPGEGKDTHSSILACRISWTILIHGVAESDMTEWLKEKKMICEVIQGISSQWVGGWSCELDSTEISEELSNVSQDCAHVPFNFCPFVWGMSLGMLSPSAPKD